MKAAPTTARPLRETEILLTVALGTMLVPLNSTMIAVALPRLIDDFNSSLSAAGWLVTGYLIAMASLQPIAGNLGDRLGRRSSSAASCGSASPRSERDSHKAFGC